MNKKGFLQSLTAWGLLLSADSTITGAATSIIVNILGVAGVIVSPEPISKTLTAIGLIIAAYGRIRADKPLSIKPIIK